MPKSNPCGYACKVAVHPLPTRAASSAKKKGRHPLRSRPFSGVRHLSRRRQSPRTVPRAYFTHRQIDRNMLISLRIFVSQQAYSSGQWTVRLHRRLPRWSQGPTRSYELSGLERLPTLAASGRAVLLRGRERCGGRGGPDFRLVWGGGVCVRGREGTSGAHRVNHCLPARIRKQMRDPSPQEAEIIAKQSKDFPRFVDEIRIAILALARLARLGRGLRPAAHKASPRCSGIGPRLLL